MVIFYEVLEELCNLTKLSYPNVNLINLEDASLAGTVKVLAYELSKQSFFGNIIDLFS
ncbi:hypothetical protein THOM_0897 [Trachipleistophora hominis]|uniref:Uncharacterized protein n=1 Tax=Trachipleistophora hominis TaxID=72359 RepID=L7JYL7_TRAHO|nr:hypothetical protein THOM_0897 [Trachipleistophora hominis]